MSDDVRGQLMDAGEASVAEPVAEASTPTPQPDPEVAALKAQLAEQGKQLASFGQTAQLIEKAKELFFPKNDQTLSPEDQKVKSELERLYPGLRNVNDVAHLRQQIAQAAQVAENGIAEIAWNYQHQLMKDHNVGVNDPETAEMIGTNIREWLVRDQSRVSRYKAGDKEVIREGFEHVVGKLFGPARLEQKRKTVASVRNAPVVPGRPGVAGGSSAPTDKPLDFSDRKAVRAALRSAYIPDAE